MLSTGVREMAKKFTIVKGEDAISIQANINATLLMNILVRSTICTKKVIEEYRLNTQAFEWVLGETETRFQQAMVSAYFIFQSEHNHGVEINSFTLIVESN